MKKSLKIIGIILLVLMGLGGLMRAIVRPAVENSFEEQIRRAKEFSKIGKSNNIIIHACCEKNFLLEYGLKCNGCMSQEIIEKSINCKLEPPKKKNLMQECNCLMRSDIGAYNTF